MSISSGPDVYKVSLAIRDGQFQHFRIAFLVTTNTYYFLQIGWLLYNFNTILLNALSLELTELEWLLPTANPFYVFLHLTLCCNLYSLLRKYILWSVAAKISTGNLLNFCPLPHMNTLNKNYCCWQSLSILLFYQIMCLGFFFFYPYSFWVISKRRKAICSIFQAI